MKGYWKDRNYPVWLDGENRTFIVMDARAKLFYAYHNNSFTRVGVYKSMEPVQLFKYGEQYWYDRGKPGLDKNTEVVLRIYKSTPVSFETKYVLTMISQFW